VSINYDYLRPMVLPDNATLERLIDYDPISGTITWLPRPREMFKSEALWKAWNKQCSGTPCGHFDKHAGGAVRIKLWDRKHLARRICYQLANGDGSLTPEQDVRHKNADPLDLRASNLELVPVEDKLPALVRWRKHRQQQEEQPQVTQVGDVTVTVSTAAAP